MQSLKKDILLCGDFNMQNLASLLSNKSLDLELAPYGQVHQVLSDKNHACRKTKHDVIIV